MSDLSPEFSPGDVRAWIEFAYPQATGELRVSHPGDWSGRSFARSDVDALIDYARRLDERAVQGIYLRASTCGPIEYGRGTAADSIEFIGFHSDIDIAGPGHKHSPADHDGLELPGDERTAFAIIAAAGLPAPTAVTRSGGGIYAWWLLDEPVIVAAAGEYDIADLSARWQEALAAGAERAGVFYGSGVGDLARVLRLPGTVNRKIDGAPTACRVAKDDGPRYPLGWLADALSEAESLGGRSSTMRTDANRCEPMRTDDPFDVPARGGGGLSPLDDLEHRQDWASILEPAGWRLHHTDRAGTRYWERPGGSSTGGHSATTGHAEDRDRMFCFTDATGLPQSTPMTKGFVYAKLYHGGDMKAAVATLRAAGFGEQPKKDDGTAEIVPEQIRKTLRSQLLTVSQLREQPNPEPLVNGVIDLDTSAWMIGKPGSYKSFVALDIAAHVATGRPWHGHAVTQGMVVYIVAEGVRGMKLRAAAWEAVHGVVGDCLLFLPRPVQVKNVLEWAELVALCEELKPALVVIDTQSRVSIGLAENDNSEMMIYVNAADDIRRATGACILTIHHQGRSGTDARGASSIDGAQDAELRLERTGDRVLTIHMDKQKDADDGEQIELELARVEHDPPYDPMTGRDLSSLAVVPAGTTERKPLHPDWKANLVPNQAAMIGIMADHVPYGGGTKAEIRKLMRTHTVVPDGSFNRTWDALQEAGLIIQIKGVQRFVLNPDRDAIEGDHIDEHERA